jgi:hypothetical protein
MFNRAGSPLLLPFLLSSALALAALGCKKEEVDRYIPDALGRVSIDNGKTYDENLKNIEVGQLFYLKFEIAIQTRDNKKSLIPFSIAIPSTEIFDCTLTDYDGTVSSVPSSDTFSDMIRYDFKTLASKNPQKAMVIFQCRAIKAGNQRIIVTYGDQVNDIYKKTMTLVYNEPVINDETNDSDEAIEE